LFILQIALYHENVKKVKMKLDVCKLHQLPSFQWFFESIYYRFALCLFHFNIGKRNEGRASGMRNVNWQKITD